MAGNKVYTKYRRGTVCTVKFPTVPSITMAPNTVTVHQDMHMHDIFVLSFNTTNEKHLKVLKTGVPVVITWNQENGKPRTLHGYVSHVAKETVGQRRAMFQIFGVGASYPLKKRSNKVYKNKTIPEVAQVMAKEVGLKYVGTKHPRRFSQLAVSGHSYWEWLHEQAARIGYGVVVDGLNLVFKPLDDLLDQSVKNSPTMSMMANPMPKNTLVFDRTLDYFEVLDGENIEVSDKLRAVKHSGGMNPLTGKSFVSKHSPKESGKHLRKKVSDTLFDEYLSGQVVDSVTNAKLAAKGSAELARLNMPAKVRGQGDTRLKPYAPVLITGTGDETDGYWVVNSVTHTITSRGIYEVEMLVTTDGTGDNDTKRPPTTNFPGIVDIEDALNNRLVVTNPGNARLVSLPIITSEVEQGFSRTHSVWQSSNKNPRRVGRA